MKFKGLDYAKAILQSTSSFFWGLSYGVTSVVVRWLPIDLASSIGGVLVKIIGPLTPNQKLVSENLQRAFPNSAASIRNKISASQWENIGRYSTESMIIDRIIRDPSRLIVTGEKFLDEARLEEQGAVFVSGHFANWEVLTAFGLKSGITCEFVHIPPANRHIAMRMKKSRERYGLRRASRAGYFGDLRKLRRGTKRGNSVALLVDLRSLRGVETPFFGIPTRRDSGCVRLALSSNKKIYPVSTRRLRGARFEIRFHPPISLVASGRRRLDLQAGVAAVNEFIEQQVRAYPGQWIWAHEKWI